MTDETGSASTSSGANGSEANGAKTPVVVTTGSPRLRVPRPVHIAIVGATGVVGREVLSILHERRFPIASLKAFASERSKGETVEVLGREQPVQMLEPGCFKGVEVAFFAAGSGTSREWAPRAAEEGAVVIDKSSLFRGDADVPLVVPEVNGDTLEGYTARRIIATPNCSTIQLVQALMPLHKKAGLKRVMVSTYQAVSGAGRAGVDELEAQVRGLFNMKDDFSQSTFGQRIAFNVIPCIPSTAPFLDDGSTEEEKKMINESRRILGIPALKISVTCARVPVFNSHSEAVHLEFERALSPEDARDALAKEPGIAIVDDPSGPLYPTATDASGEDMTFVGRIRRDTAFEHGLALWIVRDNLRTGAALNAVRIAEQLCAEHLCV